MKTPANRFLMLPATLLMTVGMGAQAADKPAESYTYATYHVCDLATQDRADEIYSEVDKPIRDAAVASGDITAYGYNKHHTGGRWRRVDYFMAPTVQDLLDAQKMMGDKAEAKNKKLGDEFAGICSAHDDYIWRRVAGSVGTVPSGGASFSTYFVCDAREMQADAIVEKMFAPIYDRMVAEGKLKSWGWMEHIVGGQFRRLETLSATDTKALMEARAAIVEATEGNPIGDAFTSICDSHADYIWEVKHSKP